MTWGILDTKDNLWLGDDTGPKLFDDLMLARCAAQLWEAQVLETDLGGRYQAREFTGAGKIRGEVEAKFSAHEALKNIEGLR